MSRVVRRLLHVFPEAPEFAGSNVVQGVPELATRTPQVAKFSVKGLGSLLQVELPPSVELSAKRNVLRGILGSGAVASSVSSRLHISRSPFTSLWGRQPVILQKVVGTTPLTCLIGSNNNSFLSALELNGTLDWVVVSPIHAYTGRQLHIAPKSGWRIGSAPFAHTVVSGRGSLCFATPSSTATISVPEGESVVVAKSHLNAFSVDTNASHTSPTLTRIAAEFKTPAIGTLDLDINHDPTVPAAEGNGQVNKARALLAKAASLSRDLLKKLSAQLKWASRSGNWGSYVEIHGPSTVIVSAASKPGNTQATFKSDALKPASTADASKADASKTGTSKEGTSKIASNEAS